MKYVFTPHELTWNSSNTQNFWDTISQSTYSSDSYFSSFVAEGIINFTTFLTAVKGEILEYGCGKGYLIDQLLNLGIPCSGCDFSEKTTSQLNERLTNHTLWKGAQRINGHTLPYSDNSFDLIFCIEVLEHIPKELQDRTFQEFLRILKPQTGRILFTTPNNENLDNNKVLCPECGAIFHRWQHIDSYTSDTISKKLERYGFHTILSNVTNFKRFQVPFLTSPYDWSL